ncbi:hypothetical protein [Microbacterium petrolearium]
MIVTVATLLGLYGALLLGLSGFSLVGPGPIVIEYSDADDTERSLGIAMGFAALLTWLVALPLGGVVGLGGDDRSHARRVRTWILLGASALLVLALTIAVLSISPPAVV